MIPAIRAVMWVFVAMSFFITMMVSARQLSTTMSPFEIMFFRSVIGVLLMAPFMWRGGRAGLATIRMKLHLGRACIQFAAQFAWIYGVTRLPLAEVTALEFTIPIWTALLAMPLLGEKMSRYRWIATLGGFAGIMIILRPGVAVVSPAALVVLAGCAAFAANHVAIKYLTRTDDPKLIVFYMNVIQIPMGLVPTVFVWVTPGWPDVPWIIVWGVAGLIANYALARALNLADATLLAPIDFFKLPFTALVAFLVFAEGLDPWTAMGAALIFCSNYVSVRRETRKGRVASGR